MRDLFPALLEAPGNGLLVDRIGLTLLHSVWQIVLLTMIFAATRRAMRNLNYSSGNIYFAGMLTLTLCLFIPVVTFFCIEPNEKSQPLAMTLAPEARNELATELVHGSSESRFVLLPAPNASVGAVEVDREEIGRQFSKSSLFSDSLWVIANWLPQSSLMWITIGWMAGATLFSARSLLGVLYVRSLRGTCIRELSEPICKIAENARKQLTVGPSVQFAISKRVAVPMVIGIVRPLVLLPAAALTQLSPKQLELIIVHELAHIIRHDLLVNLGQVLIETLLFYHPCVWWVSTIVRAERENCCDDAAVSCSNPASYARALLQLENCRSSPLLAAAANNGNLLSRVQRLAGCGNMSSSSVSSPISWIAGAMTLMLFLSILLISDSNKLLAQETDDAFKSEKLAKDISKTKVGKVLDREMDKLEQVGFSGSILVAHEGQVVLARSEGFSDAAQRKRTRPNTVYEIASITKSFTATAAMILVQQGKLDLDASVADYLPNVPIESKKISVRDLLMHQSGIPATNYGDTSEGLATAVETMFAGGPKNEPGAEFECWNQGYILLSEIISKAAGQPYTDFVREEIFEPSGMSGTCFTGDRLPKGFIESIGSGKLGPSRSCLEHPYGKMELVYQGTGGIVSNVIDMWKFHKAIMGDVLLNDESKESMHKQGVGPYACGWYPGTATSGAMKLSHSGSVRGFCGDFRRYPETDSCIVVLSNNDSAPATTVANVLEAILLPPKVPGEDLDKKMEKKIIGEYIDSNGRILIVFAGDGGMSTQYMIYWEPTNPSAPISRGNVRQGEGEKIIFYQPGSPDTVNLKYAKDESKVDSITFEALDLCFERFDIKAWGKERR